MALVQATPATASAVNPTAFSAAKPGPYARSGWTRSVASYAEPTAIAAPATTMYAPSRLSEKARKKIPIPRIGVTPSSGQVSPSKG
jgi:hypothetical protein